MRELCSTFLGRRLPDIDFRLGDIKSKTNLIGIEARTIGMSRMPKHDFAIVAITYGRRFLKQTATNMGDTNLEPSDSLGWYSVGKT